MEDKKIIAFGTCRERFAYWEHVDSVHAAQVYLAVHGISYANIFEYPTYIHIGRERIKNTFLEAKAKPSHLLYVDSDNVLPESVAYQLLQRNLPIVSALYFKRTGAPEAVALDFVDENRTKARSVSQKIREFYIDNKVDIFDGPVSLELNVDPLMKVDAVGFGCVLIARTVLEHMEEAYPGTIFGGDDPSVGEDILFCRRAKDLGYDTYVDLSQIVGHLGKHVVSAVDFMHVDIWK